VQCTRGCVSSTALVLYAHQSKHHTRMLTESGSSMWQPLVHPLRIASSVVPDVSAALWSFHDQHVLLSIYSPDACCQYLIHRIRLTDRAEIHILKTMGRFLGPYVKTMYTRWATPMLNDHFSQIREKILKGKWSVVQI